MEAAPLVAAETAPPPEAVGEAPAVGLGGEGMRDLVEAAAGAVAEPLRATKVLHSTRKSLAMIPKGWSHLTPPSPPGESAAPQMDRKTYDTENKLYAALSSPETLNMQQLAVGTTFPSRPGYGTRGKSVLVYANMLELMIPPKLTVFRHAMEIKPDPGSKRKVWRIIALLLQQPPFSQYRSSIVTDYAKYLISSKQLGQGEKDFEVPFINEGEDDPAPGAPSYKVKLLKADAYVMSDLIDMISSTSVSNDTDTRTSILQMLNIWLGHHAKSTPGLVSVGGSKTVSLSPSTPTRDLGAGLIGWRGFFSSIRVAAARILVNINVNHRVLWEPIRLDLLYGKFSQSVRDKISQQGALRGIRVRTTHLPEKKNKSGEVIPKIKSIWSFTSRKDGKNPKKPFAHPPNIKGMGFAAGPKDVEFFLDDSPQAPKGKENVKQAGKAQSGGRYISVYDYFEISQYRISIAFRVLMASQTAVAPFRISRSLPSIRSYQ